MTPAVLSRHPEAWGRFTVSIANLSPWPTGLQTPPRCGAAAHSSAPAVGYAVPTFVGRASDKAWRRGTVGGEPEGSRDPGPASKPRWDPGRPRIFTALISVFIQRR